LITAIKLPDGQVILARISGADGPVDVGFGDRARARIVEGFSQLVSAVAGNMRDALERYEADEVCVDFGIELSVQGGTVISALAEVGGAASITAHLTWKKQETTAPDEPPGSQTPAAAAAPGVPGPA